MQQRSSIGRLHEGKSGKVMTAREAMQLIGDGDTLATGYEKLKAEHAIKG